LNDESVTALGVDPCEGLGLVDTGTGWIPPSIPAYCEETYWWAYLHPRSVWLFEREWVVNLILWGNMQRLTDAVLDELAEPLSAPVLQVACVYGDFSRRLAQHTRQLGRSLHLVDVAPIQLENARRKLAGQEVIFHHQDSTCLQFAGGTFERTVVFFLLHEQPAEARRESSAEALRVTRRGGKAVFVDYHQPHRANPLRYFMHPVLKTLEPFAHDLWQRDLVQWLPPGIAPERVHSQLYAGGLYQKVVVDC